jgi:Family of unknown function (DUF5678)
MAKIDYIQLQERYGGRYIARRDDEVIASAETYDALSGQLDGMAVDWGTLVIEYVEPAWSVRVY